MTQWAEHLGMNNRLTIEDQFRLIIWWANMISIVVNPFPARDKCKKPCGRSWRAALFHWSVWLVPRQCHLTGQTTRGGGPNVCRQGGRTILEHWVTCSRTCSRVREVFSIELQGCSAFLLAPCIPEKFIWQIKKVGWLRHRVDVCTNEFVFFLATSRKVQRSWQI